MIGIVLVSSCTVFKDIKERHLVYTNYRETRSCIIWTKYITCWVHVVYLVWRTKLVVLLSNNYVQQIALSNILQLILDFFLTWISKLSQACFERKKLHAVICSVLSLWSEIWRLLISEWSQFLNCCTYNFVYVFFVGGLVVGFLSEICWLAQICLITGGCWIYLNGSWVSLENKHTTFIFWTMFSCLCGIAYRDQLSHVHAHQARTL